MALIASSENGECSRSWLQSILWSRGSGQESLRKELSKLRKIIKNSGHDIFIDGLPKDQVGLNLEILDADIISNIHFHEGEFLQGLYLPSENLFNNWLKEKRLYYSNYSNRFRTNSEINIPNLNLNDESIIAPRVAIAILPIDPTRTENQNRNHSSQVNDLLDRVSKLLLSWGSIDLFDYRTHSIHKSITSVGNSGTVKYVLESRVLKSLSTITINTQLRQLENQKILLLHRFQFSSDDLDSKDSNQKSEYVSDLADQILYTLSKKKFLEAPDEYYPLKLTMDAVFNMFKSTQEGYDLSENNLNLATELTNESSIYAWRALFATQKMDDLRVTDIKPLEEEALYFARRAIELDRYNPLTLSLITHIYSFVLKDLEVASKYIQKAKTLGSDHIMTYDTDALVQIYLGNYTLARKSAMRAFNLGRHLPFRHLHLTNLCMIESFTGNHLKAVQHGEKAMRFQAENNIGIYYPTARYLAANYSVLGEEDKLYNLMQYFPNNINILRFTENTNRTMINLN